MKGAVPALGIIDCIRPVMPNAGTAPFIGELSTPERKIYHPLRRIVTATPTDLSS